MCRNFQARQFELAASLQNAARITNVNMPEQRADPCTAYCTFSLLVLVWIALPTYLVYNAVIASASFFGEPPGPQQMADARRLLAAAGVAALVPPLLGFLLAVRWRRRVAIWVFGLALVIEAFFALMGLIASTSSGDHESARRPVTCQNHSGGDAECPGG